MILLPKPPVASRWKPTSRHLPPLGRRWLPFGIERDQTICGGIRLESIVGDYSLDVRMHQRKVSPRTMSESLKTQGVVCTLSPSSLVATTS